ncbi:glucosamine-6-phosphate deaminase [Staphylococcus epidermidis]|nr:glucosamine-6-phosphate deaminase [Staphylococcus epidermidis]
MKVINLENQENASYYAAIQIIKQLKTKSNSVLGLATGGTMIGLYKSLNHLIHVNCIDLSDVKTFNLDEYININSNHEQSYKTYMYNNFIKQNKTFNEENFFIPNGNAVDLQTEIERYEKLIKHYGYIDLQILGIGENGHIGFNEPGTAFTSKTHIVNLEASTIEANSRYFNTNEEVPNQAITMGISTILKAKKIILLAFGESKKYALRKLLDGNIEESLPASILNKHSNVEILVDNRALGI